MNISIAPSLLSADFGFLADGAKAAEQAGADELHLDIMDGHFVPNLTFGPQVVAMAKKHTRLPLNVHLMITNPDQFVQDFIGAGADTVHIHIEAECNVPDVLDLIRAEGVRVGITISPDTPVDMVYPVMHLVDEVLVMSVHPGFAGQKFIADAAVRIRSIRDHAKINRQEQMAIMVDGGINFETARVCACNGANKFVAGSFLYSAKDMKEAVSELRKIATDAFVF